MSDADDLPKIEAALASADPDERAEALGELRRLEMRGQVEMKKTIIQLLARHLNDVSGPARDVAALGLLQLGLAMDPDLRRRLIGTIERIQLLEIGRSSLSPVQLERLLRGYHPSGHTIGTLRPASKAAQGIEPAPEPPADPVAALPPDLPPPPADPKERVLLQMLLGRIRAYFNVDFAVPLEIAWRQAGGLLTDSFGDACREKGSPVLFSLSQMLSSSNPEARQFAQKLMAIIGEMSVPFAIESLAEPDKALRQIAYRLLFDVLQRAKKWSPQLQKIAFTAATTDDADPRLAAVTRLRDLLLESPVPAAIPVPVPAAAPGAEPTSAT